MAEEGLREIQLNGKQLVFLFMASTVVAVVIFLCGVMVGRGVPTAGAGELGVSAAETPVDPTSPVPSAAPAPGSTSDDRTTPLLAVDDVTYPSILEAPEPPDETLGNSSASTSIPTPSLSRSSVPSTAVQSARAAAGPNERPGVAAASPGEVPREAVAATPLSEPEGNGFVVQVAAVKSRRDAEAIARRLASKGYPTFVTAPGAGGTPSMFRVRVGKYSGKGEAQAVAARLQREERFQPWITR